MSLSDGGPHHELFDPALFGDAWSTALLAPGGSPARARSAGPVPPADVQVAGLLRWLLTRASRDGSTWLPAQVLLPALAALDVEDPSAGLQAALRSGAVAMLDTEVLALPELALAEHEVAEHVERLQLTDGSVVAVCGPAGAERRAVARAAGGTLIDDADRLGLADLAEALASVEDGETAVVAGDPDVLQAGPGTGFRDLVASGAVPVTPVDAPEGPSALDILRVGVRRGELPAPATLASPERSVVVVPVQTDEQAVARTRQLVEVSIPRAFGLTSAEVVVLTPQQRGAAGAGALAAALPARVTTVHGATGPGEAVVLVLPGSAAGVVDRALLLSALHLPVRHVSLVSGLGAALPAAVARRPAPPRTRLAALLTNEI